MYIGKNINRYYLKIQWSVQWSKVLLIADFFKLIVATGICFIVGENNCLVIEKTQIYIVSEFKHSGLTLMQKQNEGAIDCRFFLFIVSTGRCYNSRRK